MIGFDVFLERMLDELGRLELDKAMLFFLFYSKADELNNQNIACGILTAVRVIRYLAVPKVSTIEGNMIGISARDRNNNKVRKTGLLRYIHSPCKQTEPCKFWHDLVPRVFSFNRGKINMLFSLRK